RKFHQTQRTRRCGSPRRAFRASLRRHGIQPRHTDLFTFGRHFGELPARHPQRGTGAMNKLVLFDFDGTLADTAPDLGAAANVLRTRRGLPELPLDIYRNYASHGARGLLKASLDLTPEHPEYETDRKSTRLNSSHVKISYAVFCLKKKKSNRLGRLIL